MTTGVPLYLVSACGSAEQFVAAFRRYADRTGLFVPVADPLPAGKRGRIALALADGGVMIEGEAEVIASSPKPSGIHGRIGMTVRFVEPDEPSKTVIAELEKARLAMKPAPSSVPPRPAELPAEPRAVPPAPGGRIDAANALAQCVIIGDAIAFAGGEAPVAASAVDPKLGPGKFLIPSIPATGSLGGGRSAKATTPPALTPKAMAVPDVKPVGQPPTPAPVVAAPQPPAVVAAPQPPVAPAPRITPSSTPTTLGSPPIDRAPLERPRFEPRAPTRLGFPVLKLPAEPAKAAGGELADGPTAFGAPTVEPHVVDSPPTEPVSVRRTPGSPFQTPPMPTAVVPPRTAAPSTPPLNVPRSSGPLPVVSARPTVTLDAPLRPPAPRQPTPFTPLPAVRLPIADALVLDETTDISGAPVRPSKPALGIGSSVVEIVMSEEDPVPERTPAPDATKVGISAAPPRAPAAVVEPVTAGRSGGMRAAEIMAAIQGEDWTMTPDASAPTVLPARTVETMDSVRPTEQMFAHDAAGELIDYASAKAAKEPSGPGEDWTISADPNASDGWSAPAKVAKLPPQPATGNRVLAVASAEARDVVDWAEKPTGIGEPLVQIDPSLMPLVETPPPSLAPVSGQISPVQLGAGQMILPMAGPPPTPAAAMLPASTMPGVGMAPLPPAPPLLDAILPPSTTLPGAVLSGATKQGVAVPPIPVDAIAPLPLPSTPPPSPVAISPAAAPGAPPPPPLESAAAPSSLIAPPPPPSPFPPPGLPRGPRAPSIITFDGPPALDPMESTSLLTIGRRRRRVVIAISAGLVVLAGAALAVFGFGLGRSSPTPPGPGSGSAHVVTGPNGSNGSAAPAPNTAVPSPAALGSATPVVGETAPPTPQPPVAAVQPPPAPAPCKLDVESTPAGAEVWLDQTQLGVTPASVELPCGVEAKLVFKKPHYGSVTRTITPDANTQRLAVRIAAPAPAVTMLSMMVTSTPPGATITVNGKVAGVTPTTVRVPAGATLNLSKDGFVSDSDRVTAKSGSAVHVTLKRTTRARNH